MDSTLMLFNIFMGLAGPIGVSIVMLEAYWLPPILRITHSIEILADKMTYAAALILLLGRHSSRKLKDNWFRQADSLEKKIECHVFDRWQISSHIGKENIK